MSEHGSQDVSDDSNQGDKLYQQLGGVRVRETDPVIPATVVDDIKELIRKGDIETKMERWFVVGYIIDSFPKQLLDKFKKGKDRNKAFASVQKEKKEEIKLWLRNGEWEWILKEGILLFEMRLN